MIAGYKLLDLYYRNNAQMFEVGSKYTKKEKKRLLQGVG